MLAITCDTCHLTHYDECEAAASGGRCGKPDCPHADPDAAFDRGDGQNCRCCPIDHHHGQAANACQGDHGPCSLVDCTALTPLGEPCPGDHCGKDVPGCTVCRPLTIRALRGSAVMHHVSGAV